ncbi:hypothetical protein [Metabacillus fastidiosus]|uniref:hypothetical protein n=1 Tax=Metabacillus fastidiosus TaxID=1458 RepID=UPI002E1CD5F1|nr:hypothetical protein [Metabacillus fastidiosus]
MLVNAIAGYYFLSIIYVIFLVISKRKGKIVQIMILIACPFFSVFLLIAMRRKISKNGKLPEWLLRREEYEDVSLRAPDRHQEMNIIPFQDALTLNENQIKRKTLINLLKEEFLQQSDALALALQSDDTETSHYAATALQQVKSHLMKQLKKLEMELQTDEAGVDTLKQYVHVLKQSVQMEFLDEKTRTKYLYMYSQALEQLLFIDPAQSPYYYDEKVKAALELTEFKEALSVADQFLERFPHHEDAYFAAMDVHFQMRNNTAFFQIIQKLRSSSVRLSPERLNQLRYWIQGDLYEQQI